MNENDQTRTRTYHLWVWASTIYQLSKQGNPFNRPNKRPYLSKVFQHHSPNIETNLLGLFNNLETGLAAGPYVLQSCHKPWTELTNEYACWLGEGWWLSHTTRTVAIPPLGRVENRILLWSFPFSFWSSQISSLWIMNYFL